jgi:hypothetical protein
MSGMDRYGISRDIAGAASQVYDVTAVTLK